MNAASSWMLAACFTGVFQSGKGHGHMGSIAFDSLYGELRTCILLTTPDCLRKPCQRIRFRKCANDGTRVEVGP